MNNLIKKKWPTDLNRHLTKEYIHTAGKYIKNVQHHVSGNCKLKQYEYTPSKIIKIQNIDNTKC